VPEASPQFAEIALPPVVGLPADPDWDLGTYAQHTILTYFRELLAQRRVVWNNEEVEGVHQIRVAARRCRTALQTFEALWEEGEAGRFAKYLARFADTFGVARDLDVLIIYLTEQLNEVSGERRTAYQWLLRRNVALRAQEQQRLEERLRQFEQDGFPSRLVDYFSRRPRDLWALGEADG
jgi:CHAD domain-containing protein